MRITGGEWAGRRLEKPKGPPVRTTLDHVRQAIFNLIGERVAGARVLDLFSGSGALGIEAFSRGAAHVTFVDRSGFCIQAIRANLESLIPAFAGMTPSLGMTSSSGMTPPYAILRSDALAAIRRLAREGGSFDLILLDPPYGGRQARDSLIALGRYAILTPLGLSVVEHDRRDSLPPEIEGAAGRLVLHQQKRYGDTALTLYKRA